MTNRWTWKEGQPFEVWLELHYEPDPGNPQSSFVVAYLSQPTGTVFTVQLEPRNNLPNSLGPGPVMDWVRQELDSFISFLDLPIGPMPSGPSLSAIRERQPQIPIPSCTGMLSWKAGHRPGERVDLKGKGVGARVDERFGQGKISHGRVLC